MNEAREYYNSKKQEIFDQYFKSKTKKGDEIDENIFKNRKQNYNDSENHTIEEVNEGEDQTVENINQNIFKSPPQKKCMHGSVFLICDL